MKLRITCLLLALTGVNFAASITLSSVGSNYNGTDDYGILLSSGVPVAERGGSAKAGYFTISDAQVLALAGAGNYTTLFATGNFIAVTSDNFTGIVSAYGANAGFFSAGIKDYNATGLNNTLYAYFTSGTQLGLFKTSAKLIPDVGGTALEYNYSLGLASGTPIIGAAGPAYSVAYKGIGTGPRTVNSFQLVNVVPEPSALLLGICGMFSLLRRKRN